MVLYHWCSLFAAGSFLKSVVFCLKLFFYLRSSVLAVVQSIRNKANSKNNTIETELSAFMDNLPVRLALH